MEEQAAVPDRQVVAAANEFGFRLLRRLPRDAGVRNVFISPTSLSLALAMTYNGARGNTQREMAQTLGIAGLDLDRVNAANAGLVAALAQAGPRLEIAVANALWVDPKVALRSDFRSRCAALYRAEIAGLAFADPAALGVINEWVHRETRGKIRGILKPGDLTALTAVVLVNAVYFSGKWAQPFGPEQTTLESFTALGGVRRTVPMMWRSGKHSYPYYQDDEVQAIRLPYQQDAASLVIVLPRDEATFRDALARLAPELWRAWTGQMRSIPGTIGLPRFQVDYETELREALAELGMRDAFIRDAADFSGMCQDKVWVDRVRHKTRLEVDEEGSRAAAATAVCMSLGGSWGEEHFRMVVDRPFLCAIEHHRTGALLFLGAITCPEPLPRA